MGMERWAAKSANAIVVEEDNHYGLVGALAKPVAIVAPFIMAIAGKCHACRENDSFLCVLGS